MAIFYLQLAVSATLFRQRVLRCCSTLCWSVLVRPWSSQVCVACFQRDQGFRNNNMRLQIHSEYKREPILCAPPSSIGFCSSLFLFIHVTFLAFTLHVPLSIFLHSPNLPLFPDDGALRIWKNFADQKNPEMVTAWQGLSDMLPTTRGQPSASAHSKDQCSLLLCTPHQPILPQFTVHIHLQVTCPLPNCSPHPTYTPSPSNQESFQVGQASTFSFPVLLLNDVTVDCMSL